MANEPKLASHVEATSVRIVQDPPVVFTDGVATHAHSRMISKLYLYRTDPDPKAEEMPGTAVHVLQLVMSHEALLESVAFLEHRIRVMLKDGTITQEQVDLARAAWPSERSDTNAK
jgi:hypothetical protein